VAKIAVIGAGAWGTGIAIALGRKGSHAVRLWAYEPEVKASILDHRMNDLFLPEAAIPETVAPTNSLAEALDGAEIVVSVMPSHHVRRIYRQMKPYLRREVLYVSATKGVEDQTLLRMSEVIGEIAGEGPEGFAPRLGVLSGPCFAKEVARGLPTAVTIASQDAELAGIVQREFSDPNFRVYRNTDIAGVELGGSLKNVIAIAAGIAEGLKLGHNTTAALITRGLAEITRLALVCGGRPETMAGLAGLGDLVLTCTGGLSRNRTVGVALGEGGKLAEIIAGMHGMVAEGVLTTRAAVGLAARHHVEMPICAQMFEILEHDKPPMQALHELMTRPAAAEVSLQQS
jgi:glycerol-3-phosphate dehydrogenase (NAD(P)+)